MARRKSSSNDNTDEHSYMSMGVVTNNSKPVFETSEIIRSEESVHGVHKWSQIWRMVGHEKVCTWDSRTAKL